MKRHVRMNRRRWLTLSATGLAMGPAAAQAQGFAPQGTAAGAGNLDALLPDQVLLKDYRPKSVYKIHVSNIVKAKFPVIDCHHHAPARSAEQVDQEIKLMDTAGLQSSVAFMGVGEGPTY